MARKAKDASNERAGYDGALVRELLRRLDESAAELLSERGSYMQKCRQIRETMTGIFEEATARGVPGKALKKLFKARETLAKVQAEIGELEDEQYETVLKIAEGGEVRPVLDLFGYAAAKGGDDNVVEITAGRSKCRSKDAQPTEGDAEGDASHTLN